MRTAILSGVLGGLVWFTVLVAAEHGDDMYVGLGFFLLAALVAAGVVNSYAEEFDDEGDGC